MKIYKGNVYSKIISRFTLVMFLFTLVMPIYVKAETVDTNQVDVYSYFPTASEVDARFLSIAGSGLNTLSGQTITLSVAFKGTEKDFKFGVFDGDSGGEWDSRFLPLSYTIYADSLAKGNGTKKVAQYLSSDMTDNAWKDMEIPKDEEAKTASGVYYYKIVITSTDNSDPYGSNAFKIRTNGTICINEGSTFGFRAILDSYYDYKSYDKYNSFYNENPIVYPNYPDLTPTTYDGKWKFYFDVPTEPSEIAVWDGDLDYGDTYGTYKDTDDPDTPAELPDWAENASLEGIAKETLYKIYDSVSGTYRYYYSTGAPADDNLQNSEYLRNGAINYTLITPELTKGAKDNLEFKNDNPSGNTEWEQFKVSTEPFDRNKMDYHADKLPKGIYTIEIDGADMSNLNAWHCDYKILGVDKDGNPVPMLKPYILGDNVWDDVNDNKVQDDTEKGIANVVVSLLDSKGNLLETTTTDATGKYKFNIDIGDYKVQINTSNFKEGGALYNYKSSTGGDVSQPKTVNQTDLTFNFGYKKQGSLNVKYLEEGTNKELSSEESTTKPVGEGFTTKAKDISNYKLVKATLDGVDTGNKDNINGTYKEELTNVIYYYNKVIKQGTLVVKYVDEDGKEILQPESNEKTVGEDYTTVKKDIPGYEYVKVEGKESGQYVEGTTTVTYIYKKIEAPVKQGTLVVKYVDENGKEILKPESNQKTVGEDYTTVKKDISGYEYVKVEGKETGQYVEGTTTVTYIYKKIKAPVKQGTLVVKYVDENGKEIFQSESNEKTVGENYTTVKKDISGYEYVKVEGKESGQYVEATTTVTYIYKKIEAPVKQGTLVVKYVDENGKEILQPESNEKTVGEDYTTVKKDIPGYEYVKVEGKESGQYVEGTTTVTYIYKKIKAPVKQGTLVVKYLEKDSNKALAKEINSVKVIGESYITESKIISGYDLVENPKNAEGQYVDGTVEVIYYYVPKVIAAGKKIEPIKKITKIQSKKTPTVSGKTLPKTGESIPILNYISGMILILSGVGLKRKSKKIKS